MEKTHPRTKQRKAGVRLTSPEVGTKYQGRLTERTQDRGERLLPAAERTCTHLRKKWKWTVDKGTPPQRMHEMEKGDPYAVESHPGTDQRKEMGMEGGVASS